MRWCRLPILGEGLVKLGIDPRVVIVKLPGHDFGNAGRINLPHPILVAEALGVMPPCRGLSSGTIRSFPSVDFMPEWSYVVSAIEEPAVSCRSSMQQDIKQ